MTLRSRLPKHDPGGYRDEFDLSLAEEPNQWRTLIELGSASE